MKLSTSRDFRINTATLEAALQEHQQQENQQVCLLMLVYINKSLGILCRSYMDSIVKYYNMVIKSGSVEPSMAFSWLTQIKDNAHITDALNPKP